MLLVPAPPACGRRFRFVVPGLLLAALFVAILPPSASGAPARSDVTSWRASEGDFAAWALMGVKETLEDGLTIDPATARRASDRSSERGSEPQSSDDGKDALVGEALSPVTRSPFGLRRALVSLDGEAPAGSWIQTQVRARVGRVFTSWQDAGEWAAKSENEPELVERADDGASGASGYVASDKKRSARAFQVRLQLVGAGRASPSVRAVLVTLSDRIENASRSKSECSRPSSGSAARRARALQSGSARRAGGRDGAGRAKAASSRAGERADGACARRNRLGLEGRRARLQRATPGTSLEERVRQAGRQSLPGRKGVAGRRTARVGSEVGETARSLGRKPRFAEERGSRPAPQRSLPGNLGGSLDSEALMVAATRLRSLGWTQEDVMARVYAPFIVAGRAVATNTWGAPRFGPGPLIRRHEGQDVFCSYGAPVLASEAGVVEFDQGGLGGRVARLHRPDGSYWYYAHLSDWNTRDLSSGRRVAAGDVVGYCGNTGNAEGTLPHVHFGWYLPSGEARDPMRYLQRWLRIAEAGAQAELSRALTGRAREIDELTSVRRFGDQFTPDMSTLPSLEQVLPRAARVSAGAAAAPSPPGAHLVILFTALVSVCLLYVRPSALSARRRVEASTRIAGASETLGKRHAHGRDARRRGRISTLLLRALPALVLAAAFALLVRGRGTRMSSRRTQ